MTDTRRILRIHDLAKTQANAELSLAMPPTVHALSTWVQSLIVLPLMTDHLCFMTILWDFGVVVIGGTIVHYLLI